MSEDKHEEDKLDTITMSDPDLSAEEVAEQANEAKKERMLAIFLQLMESSRFRKFVDDNFVIGDAINDETKTITTCVVEKPVAVGPRMAPKQLFAMKKLLVNHGVKDEDKAFYELCALLGQDPSTQSSIVIDTDVEAAKNLKDKLDA